MNKTIYLLRHGLATHSKHGYGRKIIDATLLPEGIASTKKIAEYLKDKATDYNVSSEFIRCRETAEIIESITGKKFIFDKRLNENWNNSSETFEEFKKRMLDFVDEIRKSPYENILICTHGRVIAAIKNYIIIKEFNKSMVSDFPDCGTLAILKEKSFEVIDFRK